jgi:hypothetical protein
MLLHFIYFVLYQHAPNHPNGCPLIKLCACVISLEETIAPPGGNLRAAQ